MADLSAFLDFAITLNFKTRSATVTSVSLQPLPPEIINLDIALKITQPDRNTRTMDVIYDPAQVNNFTASKALSLDVNSQPQKGKYTVTATIKTVGYADTIIKKEFIIGYERPEVLIEKNFSLLTPYLAFEDKTLYQASGLTPTPVRNWVITADGISVYSVPLDITADLTTGGSYYDTGYSAVLTTGLTYTSAFYPYLTIIDEVSGTISADAYSIPPFEEFAAMLTEIGETSGANMTVDCCSEECDSPDYKAAYILYRDIEGHVCGVFTASLLENILKFLRIYKKYGDWGTHTLTVLSVYGRPSFCDNSGDPGGGSGNYIQNGTSVQGGASFNIDGTATIGTTPHATPASVSRIAVFIGGTLFYVTPAELRTLIGGDTPGLHTHTIGDVIGLIDALNSKVQRNDNIAAGGFPFINYDVKGLVLGGRNLLPGDIPALPITKITDLVDLLNGKAPLVHTHVIGDIDTLSIELGLRALDANVVHKSGNENISGTKVFSNSPNGPTPTNAAHLANKQYVDDKIAAAVITPGDPAIQIMSVEEVNIAGDDIFVVPAGKMIDKFMVKMSVAGTLKIGTTAGGSQIKGNDPSFDLLPTTYTTITADVVAEGAPVNIYFSAVTAPVEMRIYLRLIDSPV